MDSEIGQYLLQKFKIIKKKTLKYFFIDLKKKKRK